MKKMRRVASLLAASLIATSGLVGCSGGAQVLTEFKNRPNEVVVYYVGTNAYGQDWITEIAKKYMTDHNSDTYINLKKTVVQIEELSKIEAGVSAGDLYLLDCHMESQVHAFEDISDVYDSYPIGESEKKISEKLLPSLAAYYQNSGAQNYIMPKANIMGGMNFAYNKTVLDEIYPNGYTLPRTTDEFIEMGTDINEDAYLLISSFADNTDYAVYMFKSWFAQLIGFEAYEQFLDGRYYDEVQEKYVFDATAPTVYSQYKDAVESYYKTINNIYAKSNGYLHKNSVDMGAMDAEAVLAGFGFGENAKPGVFMVQGAYVEQEMGWMLEEQKSAGNPQEMGMMQMPVASDIIKRTPSIENDVELRTVIDYVDKVLAGESATKPENVTDEDIAIIQEARSICGTYMAGGMVIPKGSKNKAGAKDFMRYLASDEAAIIAAQNTNGLNLLPFGKQVTEEELGFERTNFMKDCMKIDNAISYVCSSDGQEHLFAYISGIGPTKTPIRTYLTTFYNGTNTLTPSTFYQENYNALEKDWERFVREYVNQGGVTD